MAEKVLHKRGQLSAILSYAEKNCEDLSDGYRNCRPPFRYKNAATGKTRECFRECYEHAAEWLTPLLQNLPRRTIVSWAGGSTEVAVTQAKEPYWVIRYNTSGAAPYISIEMRDNTTNPKEELRPMGKADIFFPESTRQAAKIAQNLLQEVKKSVELEVRLNLNRDDYEAVDENREDLVFSFPGNEPWTRFAPFVSFGALLLQLHR